MDTYRLPMRTGLVALVLLAASPFIQAAEIEPGLPANTTAVLTINLKQLLHAPVVKQHGLADLRQACQSIDAIRETLAALGFDPFRDLDRLTVASVGLGEKAEGVLILRGRFDTARFHLAAKRLVKEHSDRLRMHKNDDLKYISVVATGGHGSIVFGAGANSKKGAVLNVHTKGCLLDAFGGDCLALLDKNTLVAATSEELLKETCKRIADKDTSALNKPMRRLLAELDSKQTIVFAMRQPQPALAKSKAAGSGAAQTPTSIGLTPVLVSETTASGSVQRITFPDPIASLPPPPEPPSPEASEEPSKSLLCELSGGINLAEDFTLRCAMRVASADDARLVMKGFEELRLRMDGLMTFLAGSSKEYAFLKDIPRSFLAVRKGRILLVEGRLPAEMLAKLLGACSAKNP